MWSRLFRRFARRPAAPRPKRQPQATPGRPLTLRQWQVQAMLCTLEPAIRALLTNWLLEPARPAWLRHAPAFSRRLLPFDAPTCWRNGLPTLRKDLYEELLACWQTLDAPPETLSGLTRNGLIAAHGARLRQLAEACPHIEGAGTPADEFKLALHSIVD